MEAGELCKHGFFSGVNRNILTAAREDLAALAPDVLALHQKGNWLTACIERAADDERTFCDEKRVFRIGAV